MSQREREFTTKTEPLRYRSGLVLVRYGATGTQVAEVLSMRDGQWFGRKWLDKTRRFDQPHWYSARVILGRPERSDPRRQRAMAAVKGDG